MGSAVIYPTTPGTRYILPHTILKHTVYLRCGTAINGTVIDKISFTLDHTRGQMRKYPFLATNEFVAPGGEEAWDVVSMPVIILKNYLDASQGYYVYDYNQTGNIQWLNGGGINGNTLNYFPYNEITNQTCYTVFNPSTVTDFFSEQFTVNGPLFYQKIQPPSYSLYSTFLRTGRGITHAGYELDPIGSNKFIPKPGIRHKYLIDANIALSDINPTDLIIYNPSEVNITATNLRFPGGYTFKTIRGVYPTVAEVMADDISENGGPFNDPRDVPVKTDLTTENTNDVINFPLSALAATKHLYASRYYLDNSIPPQANPMLTVEPCVNLFDCTFDVKQGCTLLFEDYSSILGKEDHSSSHTNTRYKIQTLGGAVLRNFDEIQYLQNGIISQTTPLYYKATDKIIAGKAVTWVAPAFDTDVPQGEYSVENGADVTLQATNTIWLTDGFSVKAGGKFHAFTGSPGVPVNNCTTPNSPRMAGGQSKNGNHKISIFNLTAKPNPTSGRLSLMQFNLPAVAQQLQIMDTYGRTIFEKENYNGANDEIDFSSQPNGMYIARCITNGKSEKVTFVVNK